MVFYVGTGILRNLGNGTHSLEVYALDAKGQTLTYSTGRIFMVNATSSSRSEQPFAAGNLTIALVISTIAIVISAGLSSFCFQEKEKGMRRAVFALTAVVVIMFLMAPLAQIGVVEANPYSFLKFTRMQINSPQYQVYLSPNVDYFF